MSGLKRINIARYSPILVFMSWCGIAVPLGLKMVWDIEKLQNSMKVAEN